MATQDMKNDILPANALDIQTINSDTTTNGDIIDTQGHESLTFIMQAGTVTNGDVTMLIQDGDAANLSDAADVSDDNLIGTEAATLLDTSNTVSRIGYVGEKRYVRMSAVTDNSANLLVGCVSVLGNSRVKPNA